MGSIGVPYFIDPTLGLKESNSDKEKELSVNGVYKYENGKLKVFIDTLGQPNRIGISPNDKFLYVSDRHRLLCYELDINRNLVKALNFFDVQQVWEHMIPFTKLGWKGRDGMVVSKDNAIIDAGCGGVWFYSPKGILLGHIQTPEFTSNTPLMTKENIAIGLPENFLPSKGGVANRYKLR